MHWPQAGDVLNLRIVAARSLLVALAVFFALVIAEGAVRISPGPTSTVGDDGTDPNDKLWSDPDWRSPPPRTFRADSILGYDNAPSSFAEVPVAEHAGGKFKFQTNAYGLRRNSEIAIPAPAGTYRALIVGDSQTGGYVNNDETYPARLESRWQARAASEQVEVLNAGVFGYAPQQEFLWYQQRGVPLRPDLVVLALYVGNDVRDLVDGDPDPAIVDEQGGRVGLFNAPGTMLRLHSRLAQLAASSAKAAPWRGLVGALGLREPPPPPPFSIDDLVRVLRECHGCWLQTVKQAVRARQEPARFQAAYRRLALLMRLLNDSVAANGARFAVLVIPSKPEVEPNDEPGALPRTARLLKLPPEDLAYDDVARDRIFAAARSAGVAVIDPLPELRDAASGGRLYYRRDWHLNERGNLVLGSILDQKLVELGAGPPGIEP
jgi:hypothetical protein